MQRERHEEREGTCHHGVHCTHNGGRHWPHSPYRFIVIHSSQSASPVCYRSMSVEHGLQARLHTGHKSIWWPREHSQQPLPQRHGVCGGKRAQQWVGRHASQAQACAWWHVRGRERESIMQAQQCSSRLHGNIHSQEEMFLKPWCHGMLAGRDCMAQPGTH